MPSTSSRPSASRRRTPLAPTTGSASTVPGIGPYGCHTWRRSAASRASQSIGGQHRRRGRVPLARRGCGVRCRGATRARADGRASGDGALRGRSVLFLLSWRVQKYGAGRGRGLGRAVRTFSPVLAGAEVRTAVSVAPLAQAVGRPCVPASRRPGVPASRSPLPAPRSPLPAPRSPRPAPRAPRAANPSSKRRGAARPAGSVRQRVCQVVLQVSGTVARRAARAVGGGEKALDRLDDRGRAPARDDVEGVLPADHLAVEDGLV